MIRVSYSQTDNLLSSGGKGGAITIDNDHQFAIALAGIMKKNKKTCQVGVEFDVDEMDGYRIRTRVRILLNSCL